MGSISENDLRWFAARLSIAVEDTKRFGGMSVHELKQALGHVPGVESLTLGYALNGDELVTIAGRTVTVRPDASNEEIALAFRKPNMSTPNVSLMNPFQTKVEPMSITGAAGATLSIKDIISKSRATVQAAHAKLTTNADKVTQAAAALDSLGDDLGKEGDDLLAMIGQFKNDLGGTATG
jgi:hypothetical protein